MNLLEIDSLEAGYDDALVLRGVSLKADADEIVAVIGPNGAGKSTMLKAVYNLNHAVCGIRAIRWAGCHRPAPPTDSPGSGSTSSRRPTTSSHR